jgi:ribonuclease T1
MMQDSPRRALWPNVWGIASSLQLRVTQPTSTVGLAAFFVAMMALAFLGCRRSAGVAPTTPSATTAATSAATRLSPSGQVTAPTATVPATRGESDAGGDLDLRHVPHAEREGIRQVVGLIDAGGPFPYPKDGSVFLNLEKRLPVRPRGHYREYTVPTKGVGHRGARRVVAAKSGSLYYTNDHYDSFVVIRTHE